MSNIILPLDIESLEITSQSIDNKGNIVLEVVSKNDHSTCHKCGQKAMKRNGYSATIEVEHTKILKRKVYLRIKPVRYKCDLCDTTTTEQYDWCQRNAKVTKTMEEYIMRSLIHSTIQDVSRKENISPKTVQRVLNRRVDQEVDWDNYNDLNTIGIDEISIKKGHQDYLTVVSTKCSKGKLCIIAVLADRKKETLKSFLDSIPEHLQKTVKSVCTDMYDGFVNASIEVFGQQKVVVDRYHVAKLYRKPLDDLRIKEMARLKSELPAEEYSKLKDMMWILRKQHECLTKDDKIKLALLYKYSHTLKKAHKHAIRLTHIFNAHHSRKHASIKINRWISKVEKSGIKIFDGFIVTLIKYKPQVLNYFKNRKNSGFVEGLNNKIKVMKRRCYGLSSPSSFFQRIWLDLNGFDKFAFKQQ